MLPSNILASNTIACLILILLHTYTSYSQVIYPIYYRSEHFLAFTLDLINPIQSWINEIYAALLFIPEMLFKILELFIKENPPQIPWLPVPALIEKEDYPCRTYGIITKDGYTLKIHRIPVEKNKFSTGQVVYLQHGLLGASSDFVLLGRDHGLAFLLSDAGYDVWMGNVRGNIYSRNHTTLSTKAKEFWNFSWHEIGMIDTPTIIDFILEKTKQSSLFYIGHSQGTTTFYVMASEKPEYNSKIIAHISLAPIAFMSHLFSPLLRFMARGSMPLNAMYKMIGKYEFMPNDGYFKLVSSSVCKTRIGKTVCRNALFATMGFSPGQLNVSDIPLLFAHYPAGASTKQLLHYCQGIASGKFRQFDYGKQNYDIYYSSKPPKYDLTKITTPMYLFYSSNDWLAAKRDVEKLFAQLPNGKLLYHIPIPTWNHLDYIFGNDARKIVYEKILSILSMY